jgi:hypothetical protein
MLSNGTHDFCSSVWRVVIDKDDFPVQAAKNDGKPLYQQRHIFALVEAGRYDGKVKANLAALISNRHFIFHGVIVSILHTVREVLTGKRCVQV